MASASDRKLAEGLEHLRLADKWYLIITKTNRPDTMICLSCMCKENIFENWFLKSRTIGIIATVLAHAMGHGHGIGPEVWRTSQQHYNL